MMRVDDPRFLLELAGGTVFIAMQCLSSFILKIRYQLLSGLGTGCSAQTYYRASLKLIRSTGYVPQHHDAYGQCMFNLCFFGKY